jgi:archaeosine-15-forming tRNA-guanine transglycosylase
MATLKDALSLAYHTENHQADVVFPAGSTVNMQEVQVYFEDASGGRIRQINVTVGDEILVTARDEGGRWITVTG